LVVWWTGYDWYRPVTISERQALEIYVEEGGRLFLSSQDFLLHHHASGFARDYLGVLTYTEFVTPTEVRGVRESPVGDGFGPYRLEFPFSNWSDAVQPSPGTAVSMRDQERRGLGLSRRADGHATVFLGYPFEALPSEARTEAMRQIVGWLSWMGSSTWEADRQSVAPGGRVTYTLRLRNDGSMTVTAVLTNTLPDELTWVAGSLRGPATYSPGTHTVGWSGPVAPGLPVTISYAADVSPTLETDRVVINVARLRLEEQKIEWERAVAVWADGPDLADSGLWMDPSQVRSGNPLVHTLVLNNDGLADANLVTSTIPFWPAGAPSYSSLRSSAGTTMILTGAVRWTTAVSAGDRVTLTYVTSGPTVLMPMARYGVAFIEGIPGGPLERPAWIVVSPWRRLLPVVYRQR
jgi:uncharacterized repeat protein (TIGR01451 family)